MNPNEFQFIRKKLLKTQNQMAEILGISSKAVQSFEQGWRKIPSYVERQTLFLLAMKTHQRVSPCWEVRHCPAEMRETCPAWEFKIGHLCWFINGTVCHGKPRGSWGKKMAVCRRCKVFSSHAKQWGLASGRGALLRTG